MAKVSAGLLMYRKTGDTLEVYLVHPGGPYFRNKDEGSWTVPKGEPDGDEALLDTACREFLEEIGFAAPRTGLVALGSIRQKGGKVVHTWAFEGDLPPDHVLASNAFELEWPPRSGRKQSFPEVDRAAFFDIETATAKMNAAQRPFLERLCEALGS